MSEGYTFNLLSHKERLEEENAQLRAALNDLLDLIHTLPEAEKWDTFSTPESVVTALLLTSVKS